MINYSPHRCALCCLPMPSRSPPSALNDPLSLARKSRDTLNGTLDAHFVIYDDATIYFVVS